MEKQKRAQPYPTLP